MQNHVLNNNLNKFSPEFPEKSIIKDALGVTSPYAADSDIAISEKQISILEDAIRLYERLEDVRKFTCLALDDIETVTEEDIERALELEKAVSIDNERAVLNLIQNEGFLQDLESTDFSEILSSNPFEPEPLNEGEKLDAELLKEYTEEDFSDFDFSSEPLCDTLLSESLISDAFEGFDGTEDFQA